MVRRTLRSAIFVAVVVALPGLGAGCSLQSDAADSSQPAMRGRIVVTGSSTVAPLVGEIARRFEALHPGVRVDMQTGGSSRGIADIRRGTAHVGMISRELRPEERDLWNRVIALDGVALIVHRDNPVDRLTSEQVFDIYSGRIANWLEEGGRNAEITVVNKAAGRATLELFVAHFRLKEREIRADVVIGDNQHGIRTVAADPNAIGYVSIGTAEVEASRGAAIKMLPLDGVDPTLANVQSGSYPLSRPLNLVTYGERSALVEAFLSFASSSENYDLVEAQSFVPIAE